MSDIDDRLASHQRHVHHRNVPHRTIFCHDNLEILQGINSDCIDLIYLDPPFNKKKVFTAPSGTSAEGASFKDMFTLADLKDEWVRTIKEDRFSMHRLLEAVKDIEGRTSYNFCYLAYMAIRLIECHRVLKDTGSIYLHCDPTMSHYLKLLLDCIFGEKQFKNEVVWWYSGGGAAKTYWGRKHDIIFYYTKGIRWTFNVDEVREKHKWDKGQKRADGSSRDYEKGKLPDDVFRMHSELPWAKAHTGYPTQKPLILIDRIIKASSNKGDVVLDPFCGCATTCVAAEALGRHWIGIDISHKAYELVQSRLKDEVWNNPNSLYQYEMEYPEITYSTSPPRRTDSKEDTQERKWVYVIAHPKHNGKHKYQVGIAKNWKSRLNSYQTADPERAYEMKHKVLTPEFRELERHMHDTFDNEHEWIAGSLQDIIDEMNEYAQKTEGEGGDEAEHN